MSRVIRTRSQTRGLVIDVMPRAGTSSGRPVSNRRPGAESPSPISRTVPSTTSSQSSSERRSRSRSLCSRPRHSRSRSRVTNHSFIGSDFDRVVASSTHDSAVLVEAVNADGLVPHEPVPLVDPNLLIPPNPILVGDDNGVEQVPVPVLAQLAQAITNLARSTARPAPIPLPVPLHPPPPSTSIQTKV